MPACTTRESSTNCVTQTSKINSIVRFTPNKCGSGLARECSVSANSFLADSPHSRASPLPHF
ncbi:hypothetical protein E1K68_07730 [Pseudomonas sp. B2021]|nr:hypothetical protein [Pseudomonas sp. B2021]TKJ96122.1 hypothetical protein PflCFBP13510_27600 [Pseudomonas fluorescens]